MYTDYLQTLTDQLQKFTVPRNLFIRPYIEPSKKEGALDSYAQKLEDVPDSVWFLYDSTILGRAETGFVITSDLQLYGRKYTGTKRFQFSIVTAHITVVEEEKKSEEDTDWAVLYCNDEPVVRTSLQVCLWLHKLFTLLQGQSVDVSDPIFQQFQGRNVQQTHGCGCLVLFAFIPLAGLAPTIMNALI